MEGSVPTRRILHLDLTPFFVAVERALDPSLDGRPVIVGGEGTFGRVAAASDEAVAAGVRSGQSVASARKVCPQAVLRPGDFETYSRLSEEVSSALLAVTPRVLRPSADEAVADLTAQAPSPRHFVLAAESLRDSLRARLGLKGVALGLGSSRLGARLAARWARPRGLLLLLPAHEHSLLERVPVDAIDELHSEDVAKLRAAGIVSLAEIHGCSRDQLASVLGPAAAVRVLELVGLETAIPCTAAPQQVDEEMQVRDERPDRTSVEMLVARLATAAAERLRPFGLSAGSIQVEVRRFAGPAMLRRERIAHPSSRPDVLARLARQLAGSLLSSAVGVRALRVRLGNLQRQERQVSLFSEGATAAAG